MKNDTKHSELNCTKKNSFVWFLNLKPLWIRNKKNEQKIPLNFEAFIEIFAQFVYINFKRTNEMSTGTKRHVLFAIIFVVCIDW